MTTDAAFCPSCGTRRLGGFRFCQSCGLDFDTGAAGPGSQHGQRQDIHRTLSPSIDPAPGTPTPDLQTPFVSPQPSAPTTTSPNPPATLAGVAWLAAATAAAFLAFLQWEASRTLGTIGLADEGLSGYALGNAIGALLTAYFGARCLRNPNKGFLGTSIAFAVLNIGWGVIQVSNGATHWLFYATIVAAALAGVLSFAARDMAPQSRHSK